MIKDYCKLDILGEHENVNVLSISATIDDDIVTITNEIRRTRFEIDKLIKDEFSHLDRSTKDVMRNLRLDKYALTSNSTKYYPGRQLVSILIENFKDDTDNYLPESYEEAFNGFDEQIQENLNKVKKDYTWDHDAIQGYLITLEEGGLEAFKLRLSNMFWLTPNKHLELALKAYKSEDPKGFIKDHFAAKFQKTSDQVNLILGRIKTIINS